jgi:hypothetical protein
MGRKINELAIGDELNTKFESKKRMDHDVFSPWV